MQDALLQPDPRRYLIPYHPGDDILDRCRRTSLVAKLVDLTVSYGDEGFWSDNVSPNQPLKHINLCMTALVDKHDATIPYHNIHLNPLILLYIFVHEHTLRKV